MKAAYLAIGDEILYGKTLNTNAQWISSYLQKWGYDLSFHLTVMDTSDSIKYALDSLLESVDIVVMTGGLGPTKDDVTKHALCDYFGSTLVFDQNTYNRLERYVLSRGYTPEDIDIDNQSMVPSNAEIFANEMGTASGMWFETDRKQVIFAMPGVPYEMCHLMEHMFVPALLERLPSPDSVIHRTICTAGIGETRIARSIEDIANTVCEEGCRLAYLPSTGQVKIRLTAKSSDGDDVVASLDSYVSMISDRLGSYVYGLGDTNLALSLGELLQQKGHKMATAESCTGGYIGHLITSNAGSSAYYEGSIVSYSNAVKISMLGVDEDTLMEYGAVSRQTVEQMVRGVIERLGVDVALAVSGIAGPSGGTADKPVGTIWVAVGDNSEQKSYKLNYNKSREVNIEYAATMAMYYLFNFVNNS